MRGRVSISIAGSPAFVKRLQEAGERGITAAGAGLFAVGNTIMEQAKREVPVDLGALKGSGYVTLPERVGNDVIVEVGFGGPAKDYAVVQHEDLSLRHVNKDGSPNGGKAKYLEDPIVAAGGTAPTLLARVAGQVMASGAAMLTSVHPKTPWEG